MPPKANVVSKTQCVFYSDTVTRSRPSITLVVWLDAEQRHRPGLHRWAATLNNASCVQHVPPLFLSLFLSFGHTCTQTTKAALLCVDFSPGCSAGYNRVSASDSIKLFTVPEYSSAAAGHCSAWEYIASQVPVTAIFTHKGWSRWMTRADDVSTPPLSPCFVFKTLLLSVFPFLSHTSPSHQTGPDSRSAPLRVIRPLIKVRQMTASQTFKCSMESVWSRFFF